MKIDNAEVFGQVDRMEVQKKQEVIENSKEKSKLQEIKKPKEHPKQTKQGEDKELNRDNDRSLRDKMAEEQQGIQKNIEGMQTEAVQTAGTKRKSETTKREVETSDRSVKRARVESDKASERERKEKLQSSVVNKDREKQPENNKPKESPRERPRGREGRVEEGEASSSRSAPNGRDRGHKTSERDRGLYLSLAF